MMLSNVKHVSTSFYGDGCSRKRVHPSSVGRTCPATMSASEESVRLREIVNEFRPSKFTPSGFAQNCHWQTIIGTGALKARFFGPPQRTFEVTTERFNTLDGDFFDVEYTEGFDAPDAVRSVIILHGLESTTKGSLVTSYTQSFLKKGFSCCLVSFRSCNGEENLTPGAYHVGFTSDVNQLVHTLHDRFPQKRMYLTGFSLGGNVSLKFLGELGDNAEARGVYGGAVACVPFDPARAQSKLDVGFSRAVYSESFLETLKSKAEVEYKRFPGYFSIEEVRACTTIGAFDDAYIARIYGFKDKFHYYRSSGAKWWLHKIRVPAVAINARDDPFIEEESLPTDEHVGEHAPVRLIYPQHGGHCGFYTAQQYMGYEGGENEPVPAHGWLAEELGRVLEHLETSRFPSKVN